jgi:hypothetical protein
VWLLSVGCEAMTRFGRLSLVLVAMLGAGGLVFLHYRDQLDRAREAATGGGMTARTVVGPSNTQRGVAAFRCYRQIQ